MEFLNYQASLKTEKYFDDSNFQPKEYLETYYPPLVLDSEKINEESEISTNFENFNLIEFYAKTVLPIVSKLPSQNLKMLEVGGGPTIYQLINLASAVEQIIFTDFLKENLGTVQAWALTNNSFWKSFVTIALSLELGRNATDSEIAERENLVRKKLIFSQYDVLQNQVLAGHEFSEDQFDIVSSNFCLESITQDYNQWQNGMHTLCNKVAKNGLLIITALQNSFNYQVGNRFFPATNINSSDIEETLSNENFQILHCQTHHSLGHKLGYEGMIFTIATKT